MSDKQEVQKWADVAMFEGEAHEWTDEGVVPKVTLLTMTPDPLGAVAAFANMYEGRVVRSLQDVTDDERRRAWANATATHLAAPLEAIDLHFMVEGVDRAFTHQMVRQRTAVYAQESQRFCVIEDLEHAISLPPSLHGTTETDGEVDALFPSMRQEARWRTRWDKAIREIREQYSALVADGMPQEDARGLLPHATATRLNYKTNLRNLVDHAGNRLCTQAQYHWRSVFSQIVDEIRNFRPVVDGSRWQFELIAGSGLFKPVCYAKGRCPFKADFDRGCTIRGRADAGEFDKIRDEEWLFNPEAARVRA